MRCFSVILLVAVAVAVPGLATAAPFQYDTRWYTGVRDNVILLQDRQRARLDALEVRRHADGALLPTATALSSAVPTAVARPRADGSTLSPVVAGER